MKGIVPEKTRWRPGSRSGGRGLLSREAGEQSAAVRTLLSLQLFLKEQWRLPVTKGPVCAVLSAARGLDFLCLLLRTVSDPLLR